MANTNTFKDLSTCLYINGEWKKSTSTDFFDVVDPATEEILGQVADATDEEVRQSIDIANQAHKSWKKINGLERAELLHEVATEMRKHQHEIAVTLTHEMGKPYKESSDEVLWSASAIDYYAEIARNDIGRVMSPSVNDQMHFTLKEPLGVVVSIQPFNYPLCLLAWQAGAALGAGNAIIIKPSEFTSITTLVLMKAFAILPPGLVQCITGGGRVGNELVSSQDTHMDAFTGGIETGQRVARACADQFKPTLIEASGNDAFIVMPSTNMSTAVQGARFAAYLNCGQVCTSAERFFVHESIYDQFAEQLTEATQALRIGNGFQSIDIGPMVTSDQRESYENIVARAIEQGANVLCGSKRPDGINKGWFTSPTVLSDITSDMDILQGESFGPVAPLCPVSSLDEAIALTNSSKYGLGATIYTNDLNEAMQAVHEIDTGMVWVNAPLLDNDAGPFGGRKLSGLGRELGPEGLDTFRSSKLVMIDHAASEQDFWWFPYKDAEAYSE